MRLERDRGDTGAVAILVAIMAVLLVGMAAFSVDFGVAYANKTALQKAADAAALAAAGKIISSVAPTATCSDILTAFNADTNGLKTTATALADSIATANTPVSKPDDSDPMNPDHLQVACPANGHVEVAYKNKGSEASIFGGLFGVSTLSSSREATADIFAAPSLLGLRPYAVCAVDAKTMQDLWASNPSGPHWVGIPYPNPTCDTTFSYSGNWYTLNCPEDGSSGKLDTDTLNGCKDEVGIIPQSDPAVVFPTITTQCTAAAASPYGPPLVPQECMRGNAGDVAANGVVLAWDQLLSKPSIVIPVFDPSWNLFASTVGKCAGGSNGCYPIQALASVKVCGYMWGGKKTNYDMATVGPGGVCAGVDKAVAQALADTRPPVKGPKDELWLALTTSLQVSGTSGPGGDSVGSGYGVYGTRLIK